jgi:hypothetical protein
VTNFKQLNAVEVIRSEGLHLLVKKNSQPFTEKGKFLNVFK